MRLLPVLAALLIPVGAAAQSVAPPVDDAAPAAAARPDIEFAATVHMDSISFGSEPKAAVRLTGGPHLQPRHDVERDRLPRPVGAGRAYRDVTVRTTISATLLDPAIEAAAAGQASPSASSPTTDEDSP